MNFNIGDAIYTYDDLRKLPEGTVFTAHGNATYGERILETRDGVLGLWRGDENHLSPLSRGETGKFPGSLHYIIKELPRDIIKELSREEALTLEQIRSLPHGTTLRISGCTTHTLGTAPDGTGWFNSYRIVERDGDRIGLRFAVYEEGRHGPLHDITDATELPTTTIRGYYLKESVKQEPVESELDAFKAKVVEVATRLAKEHGFCNVVDDALEEMGLPARNRKRRFEFTVTADITAGRDVDIRDIDGNVTINLLDNIADAIRESLRADFTLETASISDVTIEER